MDRRGGVNSARNRQEGILDGEEVRAILYLVSCVYYSLLLPHLDSRYSPSSYLSQDTISFPTLVNLIEEVITQTFVSPAINYFQCEVNSRTEILSVLSCGCAGDGEVKLNSTSNTNQNNFEVEVKVRRKIGEMEQIVDSQTKQNEEEEDDDELLFDEECVVGVVQQSVGTFEVNTQIIYYSFDKIEFYFCLRHYLAF